MARLLATAALACILLALVANASAYRTTITTVEFDDQSSKSRESGRCREQIRKADLSQCEEYVSQSRPRLALRGIHNPEQQEEQQLQQCCQRLREIDRQCQCDALQSVFDRQTEQRGPAERETIEQVAKKALEIQTQCRLPDYKKFQEFTRHCPGVLAQHNSITIFCYTKVTWSANFEAENFDIMEIDWRSKRFTVKQLEMDQKILG
ncbi:unnamed protein product [Dovyalis caffra]|uniref:Bifunctional inhibitor/plant lipid transfer protein/seed storage helical domain-containing protein n=1 Tax=Dovyalis caffra TaxID=77055 RepID=A0AAV1RNS1_9ROSI|nr:unnamed protein product [Dovyalis caffra]